MYDAQNCDHAIFIHGIAMVTISSSEVSSLLQVTPISSPPACWSESGEASVGA